MQVREHAAGVLASLMKGGDEELSRAFRERSYAEAQKILTKRKQRFFTIIDVNFKNIIFVPLHMLSGSRLSMMTQGFEYV